MNIDVSYNPSHDRLRLRLRHDSQRLDWWLTRRILLAWISTWLRQLESVDLPAVAGLTLPRDLGTEHHLSLEFDGPAAAPASVHDLPTTAEWMLEEVTLSVQPSGCGLLLKANGHQQALELTRKESHALLDMLAGRARAAGWLHAPDWPAWLGAS